MKISDVIVDLRKEPRYFWVHVLSFRHKVLLLPFRDKNLQSQRFKLIH